MNQDKKAIGWRTWSLPALLTVTLVTTALFHGGRGLYESTEGRYAECAREMLRAGEWLTPLLNGEPHWTKPPVTYWLIQAPCAVFGPTTWAARLYLIPCHLVAVAAVWWMALRILRSREAAMLSATVYATTAMVMLGTQIVSTDYPLTAALAVAHAFFWETIRSRSRWAAAGLWFTLGVASLVKGPPALLVLPAFVAAWFRLPREERRQTPLFAPAALAVFGAVALSWYVWEAIRTPGLLGYWLHEEVVNRSLSDKFNRNPSFYMNFVIYLPVLVFGTLPWSGWLAIRARDVWRTARRAGVGRRAWTAFSPEAIWLLASTAFPLAVFFVSRSKLPLYVLPLFVPLAVGTARLLMAAYAADGWFWRKAVPASVGAVFALFVVGKAVSAKVPSDRNMAHVHRALVERYGIRQPDRLAVISSHPLNGLSYYYDSLLRMLNLDAGEIDKWAGEGGERHLLVSRKYVPQITAYLRERVTGVRDVTSRWRLVTINNSATNSVER